MGAETAKLAAGVTALAAAGDALAMTAGGVASDRDVEAYQTATASKQATAAPEIQTLRALLTTLLLGAGLTVDKIRTESSSRGDGFVPSLRAANKSGRGEGPPWPEGPGV
ncbi:MAG TPA: hypothetical protein VLA16_06535 [Ideonella sp.]|nr:hypothetical protein [Ideonella sp.]